jgi:hypothetical protein
VIHDKEIPRRRLRVSRKPFHGHTRNVITNSNGPKPSISKRLPASGLEVPFKPGRLIPGIRCIPRLRRRATSPAPCSAFRAQSS